MTKPKSVQLNKNKILRQLLNLDAVIKASGWRFEYDPDVDELFFGEKVMPKGSFLFSVDDEINLFLTPDSKVNGIFIEYFANNFIEHNKKLKPALDALQNTRTKIDKEKQELATEALEEKLLREASSSVFGRSRLVAAVI